MNRAYSRAGIIARLFNQPLAVLPSTAAIVLGAVGPRLDVQQLFVATEGRTVGRPELEQLAADQLVEIRAAGGVDRAARNMPANRLMFVGRGVAHIGVRGETVAENDGAIGPESGFTGYDGLIAQVHSADADPNVRGLLVDIDSSGGEVSGLFEACAILMARRGTKPMRAMIRGVGASAAYAIAACADEITLHERGVAGSIGCLSMHADFSGKLEQDGVKVTLFASGAHKTDGNPFEPLPAEVSERVQASVNASAERFFAHIAEARGLSVEVVRAQQAQLFTGEEAVAAGLVDKIMGWQDSMDEFEAAVNGTGSRPTGTAPSGVTAKGNTMSEFTQAQLDAAVATARTEASAEATTATATAERERFAQLAELDGGSKISAELSAAITGGTGVAEFALAQSRAGKAKLDAAAANAEAEAIQGEDLPEGGGTARPGAKAPAVNRGQAYADAKKARAQA